MNRLKLTFVIVVSLAACAAERAPLVASEIVVARPKSGTQMTAGYFTLHSNAQQVITISAVTSPEFETVEMHESIIEDGVARMYPLGELTIRPGETVKFEPRGKHLMLLGPIGEFNAVTLEFYARDAVVFTVTVQLSE